MKIQGKIRVGISGAAGAGKTRLAEGIVDWLTQQNDGTFGPVGLVDGYVDRLRSRTDKAYGFFGDYIDNLAVANERLLAETELGNDSQGVVSCGTIFDTLLYAAMFADWANTQVPGNDQARFARANTVMHALGMYANDTWSYDYFFYLPLPAEVRETNLGQDVKFDQELPAAFSAFMANPLPLDLGNHDDNLKLATGYIEAIETRKNQQSEPKEETAESPDAEEPGDGGSPSASEEVGSPA